MMLETSEERIKMLKLGISSKKIEDLYIEFNNFRVIHTPILGECDFKQNKKAGIGHKAAMKYSKPSSAAKGVLCYPSLFAGYNIQNPHT